MTENQNSVLVHVHDFLSYFWIECPAELNPSPENLEQLKAALNVNFFIEGMTKLYRPDVKLSLTSIINMLL